MPFRPGDYIVINDVAGDECDDPDRDRVSTNYVAVVVQFSWSGDRSGGPFSFSSPDVDITVSGRASATHAFQNELYVDQYKVLYGHSDMRFGELQYFVRVKHSHCGDLMFGRIVMVNGARFVFGGILASAQTKRKYWQ